MSNRVNYPNNATVEVARINYLINYFAAEKSTKNMHSKLPFSLSIHRLSVPILLVLLLSLVFLPTQGFSQSATTKSGIAPFDVEYNVGNNLITAGSAKLTLKKEADEWIYSLTTTPSGIFKLTGKGKIQEISVVKFYDEKAMEPKRYTYRQDQESRRSVDAWFNWEDKELKYKRRGEEVVEPINDPILDRLSVTLTIMEQLKAGGFEQAALQVFDNGKIKTVVFENLGEAELSTNLGRFNTIKVKSFNSDGSRKRVTTTWFAPALDFIPVMMEQHKQGQLVARLTISKLKNL